MKITKVYETIINMTATEMYSGDIDAVILGKLQQRFNGKCEQNSLIIDVNRIVKRSKIQIAKNQLDGIGNLNVQYEATAMVFMPGEILTGCKIQRIEASNIFCSHPQAVVSIKASGLLRSLRVGQMISVRINSVSYIKGREKLSCIGSPYSYPFKQVDVLVVDPGAIITTENTEILRRKLYEVEEEFKLRQQADPKLIKFFSDTFYPFKQFKSEDFKGLVDAVDYCRKILDKPPASSETCIIRSPRIDKSTRFIIIYDLDHIDDLGLKEFDIQLVKEDFTAAMLIVLNDILNYGRMIREMTDVYPTEKDIDQHSNLWTIYGDFKQ